MTTQLSQDEKIFKSALSSFVRWSVTTHTTRAKPGREMGHTSVAGISHEFNSHMDNMTECASILTLQQLERCEEIVVAALPSDENRDYALARVAVAMGRCRPRAHRM